MSGVLLGFGVVLVLVGIGAGAAVLLPGRAPDMERGLQPAIYYVTNPALMLVLISDADLGAIVGVFTPIALLTAAPWRPRTSTRATSGSRSRSMRWAEPTRSSPCCWGEEKGRRRRDGSRLRGTMAAPP